MFPDYCNRLPNRSPCCRITLLREDAFVPLCHPQNKATAPLAWPAAPPSPGLCLLPGAHCPLWGQLLGWQGVCPPAPWCGLMAHHKSLCCFFPFVCHILPTSFSLVLLFYHDSAKTSLPESQVSVSFSGLCTFSLYKFRLKCSC